MQRLTVPMTMLCVISLAQAQDCDGAFYLVDGLSMELERSTLHCQMFLSKRL
ncbi:hypothetical protein NIES3974_38700 [Calothrix sp. NIES-3974]|nr:hypothetical protein NIES3974_38700 [Calothrix sp. NIES-3974]